MTEEHPSHYNKGKIEVWDFIADQAMGFLEGNIVKYLCRYRFKGTPMKDLLKAKAYLDRLIMERACFEAEVDAKAAEFKRAFEATALPLEMVKPSGGKYSGLPLAFTITKCEACQAVVAPSQRWCDACRGTDVTRNADGSPKTFRHDGAFQPIATGVPDNLHVDDLGRNGE